MRSSSQDVPEHIQSAFNTFMNAKVDGIHAQKQRELADCATIIQARQDEFEALHQSYRASFRPNGVHEEFLVREMACSDWRLRLLGRIELAVTWAHTEAVYSDDFGGMHFMNLEEKTISVLLGIAWLGNPKVFSMLYRAQSQARRAYNSALKTLEKLRSGKARYMPPPEPESKAVVSETAKQAGRTHAAAASANQTNPIGETNPTPPDAPQKDETNPILSRPALAAGPEGRHPNR